MIIKRNQAGNKGSSSSAEASSSKTQEEAWGMNLASDPWNDVALEVGDLQEQRMTDRRRSYRRVEEKALITQAHEEAQAIRENAQREGFEEGLRQAEASIAELREALAEVLNGREEALLSIADEIAPLAIEVAERIIKTEVSCDESLVMALVRDTIQKAGRNNKSILVKVHPDDVRIVKQSLKDEPIPNLNAELIVMDDPMVDAGSCIIETSSGLIDASFSTQLELLKRLFGTGG